MNVGENIEFRAVFQIGIDPVGFNGQRGKTSSQSKSFGLAFVRRPIGIESDQNRSQRRSGTGTDLYGGDAKAPLLWRTGSEQCAPPLIWHQQGAPSSLAETNAVICSMISAKGRAPLIFSRTWLRCRCRVASAATRAAIAAVCRRSLRYSSGCIPYGYCVVLHSDGCGTGSCDLVAHNSQAQQRSGQSGSSGCLRGDSHLFSLLGICWTLRSR